MAGESVNQDSPMLLDVTGIAIVNKLQDIASAISAGGGGGGGSIKRCPTIVNTKRRNCFITKSMTAQQVNGVPANLVGKYVWIYTDFNNDYNDRYFYNKGNDSYEINVGSREITNKSWTNLPYNFGNEPENIWNDGVDIYFSNNWGHYKLDMANNRWTSVSTSTLGKSFKGNEVWTDGTDIYVTSNTSSPYNYVLNRTTGKFVDKTWTSMPSNFVAKNVWRDEITDDSNIKTYYSNGSVQYELDIANNQWITKTWSGMTNFYGQYVWLDKYNSHIYYSYKYNSTTTQKVLDTSNDEWTDKTWSELTSYSAENIWYADYYNNKYYSDGSIQYEMYSDEWYPMSYNDDEWSGVTKTFNQAFSNSNLKNCIWTDGNRVFYSAGKLSEKNQYVYNDTTGQWDAVTWYAHDSSYNSVDIYMNGCDIWTDGKHIFVSNHQNTENYIIDSTPDDYSSGEINAASIKDENDQDLLFDGSGIWTDGKTIYLSYFHNNYYTDQYVLTGDYDNNGYVFEEKTWEGPTGFDANNLRGEYIWTDGENIYHDYDGYDYVLNGTTGKWESKSWYDSNNSSISISGLAVWTDGVDFFYYDGNYDDCYHVLDKATGMWAIMATIGNSGNEIAPQNIWSDGEKIFMRGYSDVVYTVKSSRNTTLTLCT